MSDLVSSAPSSAAAPASSANNVASYDAFVSYSHARDKPIAAALQSAMQRLGKAWNQRRALRLFRDDTSLSATPHLWPSIEQALGKARFLILLASPEAASSPWVDKELAWWLDHNGSDTVLIALTAGDLAWDGAAGDFQWSAAPPLPPALKGRFADEPRWIDLRPYRERASPRDARFTELAAEFAAALHGRAKEDLLSQEVRQQRRALRLAGSAVVLLVVLLALAGWQWAVARAQRNRAEHTLALATETANGLVFNLAQKFRDSGLPVEVIGDILDRARKLQDQLAAAGETSPELRRSQAAALDETVRELLAIGDTKGALAAAQQEQALMQALLAASPGNTDYQRGLAISDDKIGGVLVAQGDLASALAAYRDSLAIRQTLAAKDGDNTDNQRALAISDDKIGDVLRAQGDLVAALTSYRDSLAILKTLVAKDPGNTDWQRDLSVSDDKIGNVLQAQSDLPGALALYRDSLAIAKALDAKDPGNTKWQRDLAVSDDKIGEVLQAQEDLPGALALYRDSLAIRKTLAAKDPGNTQWQRDLAASEGGIADVLQAQGDLVGALTSSRDSLAILKTLVAKDPGNAEWQRDVSVSDNDVGYLLQAQGDLAGALANYRDSLAIRRQLYKLSPIPSAKTDLVTVLGRLSFALLFNHQPQEALDDAQEALVLDPSALWIATNEAHALLFLGRFDEAKAIYLENKDKLLGNGKTFGANVRDDFAQLRKAGIDTPDMARILTLLAS